MIFPRATVLPQIMAQPFWPVQMEDLESSFEFIDWPTDASVRPHLFRQAGDALVFRASSRRMHRVPHRRAGDGQVDGLCHGHRVGPVHRRSRKKRSFDCAASRGRRTCWSWTASLTRRQYPRFTGWGHSTWEDDVEVAREVRARLLGRHPSRPQNPDSRLERIETELTQEMPDAKLARDGMEIVL